MRFSFGWKWTLPALSSVAAMVMVPACASGPGENDPAEESVAAAEEAVQVSGGPNKAVCEDLGPGFAHCNVTVRTESDGETVIPLAAPGNWLGALDLRDAYKVPATGEGVTVAIVDAFDNPTAEQDLAYYRQTYGLPPCTTANGCFRKVNQLGAAGPLPAANTGWALEIALDIEMVSAVCPKCKILLVEANGAGVDDIGASVNKAVEMGAAVVSNSYGIPDGPWSVGLEAQYYTHPGVAITAGSGDGGYGVIFPASGKNVIAVGGTILAKAGNSRGWTETAWPGSGSGCSQFVSKPAHQKDLGCPGRTVADVSAVADNIAVYQTYGWGGWVGVGGTSAASPIVAAVLAASNRANVDPSWFYAHKSSLYDITSGSNGSCSPSDYLCNAGPDYDGPTGLGTPNGAALAPVMTLDAPNGDFSQSSVVPYISYKGWDGTNWCASVTGGTFLHAPDCNWTLAHPDTIINFKAWNGSNWTAKIDGSRFLLGSSGDFSQVKFAEILDYKSWDLSNRSARLPATLLRAPNGDFSQVEPYWYATYVGWDATRWCAALYGSTFLHAPNCNWSLAHRNNIINYKAWDGSNWTAKVSGKMFLYGPSGGIVQGQSTDTLNYESWDQSAWSMRLRCSDPLNDDAACGATCVYIRRGNQGTVSDAMVSFTHPSTNYGNTQTASVGGLSPELKQMLLRFDLGGIPLGSQITSAVVNLKEMKKVGTGVVRVHRALTGWAESSVSWENFGGAYDPEVMSSFSNASTRPSLDLAALVQSWATMPETNAGLLLEQDGSAATIFNSSEFSIASYRPTLYVCYVPPG
jgi:hypothetical protein